MLNKGIFAAVCLFIHLQVQALVMDFWRQIAEYLYIKKRDPNQPRTKYIKYMHGMNRISLLMFITAVIIILIKLVFIPLFRH